ncbi:MAG: EcoKI restriction-modification system protein HsdS [Candidatus Accumulibacter regalis]|uniref:EcoKI restriction-modification system protein HsdS n=1 Tax=Accumulibacter regalis TaxID=522306 RepID=A0A011QHF9_ACCRE|nr:restriction endonuclease subunit S [Accumulibacter sp.]EXI88752.1 MAG: EcoKI restriction-modification system protein HsdS [Candidatus Accumulibacter regalis]HRE72737.1 restriction endonuclease subunit S [Accumulibacter sp.]
MSEARTTGWTKGTLGEILPIKYGKSLPAKLRDSSGRFPVFGSSGRVGVHVQPLTNGPALIVGRKGTVGAVHFSTEPCWPIDTVYFSEGEQGQNLRYFKYLLDSLNLVQLDKSTAIPGLSRDDYNALNVRIAPPVEQERIVAEVEKQFSRLDEAVANLNRVKTNAQHFKRATIQAQTASNSFSTKIAGTVADIAVSLDNMREPVNKTERAKRVGTIPYLGANGQTGWIDEARFDEELVLVVEDETFVGRKLPFSYYFSGKCWVNNHTHVLRARSDAVLPKYLNLALSYYPFIPLTTGSTGRRKLTKAALMSAPIVVPDLATQHRIVAEVDRHLSIVREVESEVDANLKRAQVLRQAVLARAFAPPGATCAGQSEHVVATA